MAVALGLVAVVVFFFVIAAWTTSIPLAVVLALVAGFVTTHLVSLLALRRTRHRIVGSLSVALVATAVVAVVGASTVFRPIDYDVAAGESTAEADYWSLPNGDTLAYLHTPAATPSKSPPVVFLHGGPGTPGTPGEPGARDRRGRPWTASTSTPTTRSVPAGRTASTMCVTTPWRGTSKNSS